mgnify:CR=1 FL=1
MRTALFTNWTLEEFTGWWDGKAKKFAPGQSLWMPDYLASHFAKHLANRELLRRGPDGKLVYENGEKYTSPKFPDQVPVFLELFNKAFHPEEGESIGEKKDDLDTLIDVANKNRQKVGSKNADIASKVTGSNEPQVIPEPPDDEDESSFNKTV